MSLAPRAAASRKIVFCIRTIGERSTVGLAWRGVVRSIKAGSCDMETPTGGDSAKGALIKNRPDNQVKAPESQILKSEIANWIVKPQEVQFAISDFRICDSSVSGEAMSSRFEPV